MTASEKIHLPFDGLMALSKAEGPFDRPFYKPFEKPFDKLTILSEVEGLTALGAFYPAV